MTSDPKVLKQYEYHPVTLPLPSPPIIEHVPQVRKIKPVAKLNKKAKIDPEDAKLTDNYYLKRHRRHEKEEKTQKNREKERLRHGYYQQKQLVERIKTMDKSLLQSIVSSIRHRTHLEGEEEEEEAYLNDLHCRLLSDAVEHLRRYEVLGLNNNNHKQDLMDVDDQHLDTVSSSTSSSSVPVAVSTTTNNTKFQKALQTEAIKQRERQIKSFSKQPMFTGESLHRGARRSTRHVLAFGQKLPEFDLEEFSLPPYILNWKNKLS